MVTAPPPLLRCAVLSHNFETEEHRTYAALLPPPKVVCYEEEQWSPSSGQARSQFGWSETRKPENVFRNATHLFCCVTIIEGRQAVVVSVVAAAVQRRKKNGCGDHFSCSTCSAGGDDDDLVVNIDASDLFKSTDWH